MSDDRQPPPAPADEDALERIEEARSEAAAYIVQREPLEPASAEGIAAAEERIVDAVEEARTETDPDELQDLADEAEAGRDEVRRKMYGRGSDTGTEGRDPAK